MQYLGFDSPVLQQTGADFDALVRTFNTARDRVERFRRSLNAVQNPGLADRLGDRLSAAIDDLDSARAALVERMGPPDLRPRLAFAANCAVIRFALPTVDPSVSRDVDPAELLIVTAELATLAHPANRDAQPVL